MRSTRTSGLFALAVLFGVTVAPDGLRAADPDLPPIVRAQRYKARRASSWNPTGANHDNITLPADKETVVSTLEGPGIIRHLWFTIGTNHPKYLSDLVLRITWDDASKPAVDSPFGPFFGLGHDRCADVVSAPIVVMTGKAAFIKDPPGRAAFNCYFPMPFRTHARIAVVNRCGEEIPNFFYHIDYQRHTSLPHDVLAFHARYRSERTHPAPEPDGKNVTGKENYCILETQGEGHYIGCTLHVEAHASEPGKWYEGDDLIVVDDEPLAQAIHGTGSEDYFNMAWGVRRHFQSPFFGTSYHAWNTDERKNAHFGRFSVYRWHLQDPIPFERSIRVSIEHGHNNDAGNRYASVAYWYARVKPVAARTRGRRRSVASSR